MIRTNKAYEETFKRLEENQKVIDAQRAELEKMGLSEDKVNQAMAPLIYFREQMVQEVQQYERIKKGDFSDFTELTDAGKLLIAIRIYKDITQRELADRLGVSEAQVSRDERNEYYRASPERIQEVLNALGESVNLSISKQERQLVS